MGNHFSKKQGVGAGANQLFGFGGVVGMAQGGLVISGSKNIINSILGGGFS